MHNGERLRALRYALSVSVNDMADLFGLSGSGSGDKIRDMERGARDLSGPMLRLLSYMEQAAEVGADALDTDRFYRLLPRWLDCTDLESPDDGAVEVVMHTRYPRFYAIMMPDKFSEDDRLMLDDAGIPVIGLPDELGLTDMVVLFIDQPVRETKTLLTECAQLKIRQAIDDLGGS